MPTTPREAIAKALWLREAMHRHPQNWPDNFAWHEAMIATAEGRKLAANSAIGGCIARAEKVLRLLEAAGVRAEVID